MLYLFNLSLKYFFLCFPAQVKAGEKIDITRKQSFKIITTRNHYAGVQKLSLIIKGVEKSTERIPGN